MSYDEFTKAFDLLRDPLIGIANVYQKTSTKYPPRHKLTLKVWSRSMRRHFGTRSAGSYHRILTASTSYSPAALTWASSATTTDWSRHGQR
jgi:hypothetical protein